MTYRTGPISAAKRTFSLVAAAWRLALRERLGGSLPSALRRSRSYGRVSFDISPNPAGTAACFTTY
jgi:hypothetical protein